ncbi:beta-1,3-galactosyl-O-glycosyl-glycoprotein beta-1,6-N-acetylglucosaminyltransferase 4-like [Colossoma macropomum]|uniref:beta-1,3-galactosyl-O-glycosyl-glycoprotein beta-1,6-N-acetylglucosaminyltransferase 4-like n=1 Tax=Colossoma macropomum TaxID=42526 RepID=UPI00186483C5|nr:beta-1,3-galactosyl-O-glycosyl-glycoprotein beta-1,6-N-acetylglucosaminyltransferase 4-like [Colossoma macropomum]
MRRCIVQRKLRRTSLFFTSALICLCLIIGYTMFRKCYYLSGRKEQSDQTNSRRLTEQHGIDCSDIYELDPVAVGKSLALRRQAIRVLDDEDIANATSDCRRYLASKGYGSIRTSELERDFPLAYSLVVHKDAAMVERILRAIYVPHNSYCIHYDLKSSPQFVAAMQGLARCLPNVFIASKLERVQYASITRLRADLNCLSDLMVSEIKWKYAINLCGQDFPLRSNVELVEELKALKGGSMMETVRPSALKRKRFSYRYALKDTQSQFHHLPVKTDQVKSPPPHGIEMFVGSAYFVLSREFVSFVQWSPLVKDFLSWSEDTYSPDEHFWASLIRVPGVPGGLKSSDPDVSDLVSRTRLVKWQYLEDTLYPPCTGIHVRSVCIYGAAELRWLLYYGHWFANKVDPRVDPVLVECLEEKLAERQAVMSTAH